MLRCLTQALTSFRCACASGLQHAFNIWEVAKVFVQPDKLSQLAC